MSDGWTICTRGNGMHSYPATMPSCSWCDWHEARDNAVKSLERIKVAFQALRDGKEHASSKLYRTLAAEFPTPPDADSATHA